MFDSSKLTHVRLAVPMAITAGLTIAVAAGLLIGGGEMGTLKRLAVLIFGIAYVVFLYSYTWKFAMLICLLGFIHFGFGFKIGAVELTGMLAAATIVATGWRKQRITAPAAMETIVFRVFSMAILCWLVYSTGHAIFTVMDPFLRYDFALKNFAKTVAGATGSWMLVYYFMYRPRGIVADEKMLSSVIVISGFGLIINIAIRIWGIMHGVHQPELASQFGDEGGFFVIPGLDLVEDPYALRSIAPFTATVCAVLIGGNWLRRQSPLLRFLVATLLPLSFFGAIASGGRATVVFVFALTAIALWMRKFYRLVLTAGVAGLFAIVALNLIPGVLKSVPEVMQRSLQMVIFTDESEFARLSITDSSNWRWTLVNRAYAEWKSHPRIFWFGRGTYKFGNEDIIAQRRNIGEGAMETSLRRGSTHSLVTDLLVIYGLCGFVVFVTMMVSLLWFLWRLYRHPSVDEVARAVILICFIQIGFNFAYALIGGGGTPTQVQWLLIALFGYLYYLEAKRIRAEQAAKPGRLQRVPRTASPRLMPLAPVGPFMPGARSPRRQHRGEATQRRI